MQSEISQAVTFSKKLESFRRKRLVAISEDDPELDAADSVFVHRVDDPQIVEH
jgi:hypothetical protein